MTSSDYYALLQVDRRAEKEVIDAAYRRLAAKYHPDVNYAANATEKMKQLNAAYEVLSDPVRRAEYDASRTRRRRTSRAPRRGQVREGPSVVETRRVTIAWLPSLAMFAALVLASRLFRLGTGETAVVVVVAVVLWLLSRKS